MNAVFYEKLKQCIYRIKHYKQ